MNQIVTVTKAGQLYARMQVAIRECHSVDDCKAIADQANAIKAYFKQINDDESVRKFLEIKLRAWRRIGEICLTIDDSGCDTTTDYINKIRQLFPTMTEYNVRQALNVARLPGDFFESQVREHSSVSGIAAAYQRFLLAEWEASPEGQKELQERREQAKKYAAEDAKARAKQAAREEQEAVERWKALKQAAAEHRELQALKDARDEAIAEVGITLDRRDRRQMKAVVFLIKTSVHEVLRQAAFDHRITMQAVLRAGLAMWFVANGYDTDEMGLQPSPLQQPPGSKPPRSAPGAPQ